MLSVVEVVDENDYSKSKFTLDAKARRVPAHYTYKTYDEGIVKQWSYLSRPYFIRSIARGQTVSDETSRKLKVDILQKFSGLSGGYLDSAELTYGIEVTKKTTVVFSGPPNGSKYKSRDFFYKKGRHKDKVRVVKYKNRSGHLTYVSKDYGYVEKAALKVYSVNRKN